MDPREGQMRQPRSTTTAAVVLGTALTLAAAACGDAPETAGAGTTTTTTTTTATPTPVEQPTTGPAKGFDVAGFANPTTVDNTWLPMKPGTHLVYRGETIEEEEKIPHRVEFTVTDLTKVVAGVEAVVVLELDYSDDQLEEAELALFAQADDKTIWHLGQYPEAYEEGKVVETPAWVHGVKGAQAGITIREDDTAGDPSYSQGWGPEVGWSDRARVVKVDQRTCVEAGCYEGVKVTEESSDDEPGALQLKYYAPGVGNVRVGWAGTDPTKETLELVSAETLDAAALAKARAAALKLEKSAYQRSKEVWGTTDPAS
jgi:hypothetical protein